MTFSLLSDLATAEADRVFFTSKDGDLTAGQVRAAAGLVAEDLSETEQSEGANVVLFTRSLGAFAAGLLGARLAGRDVILPAHDAPDYLDDVAARMPFVTDDPSLTCGARTYLLKMRTDSTAPPVPVPLPMPEPRAGMTLTFFTSGSTAAPKPIAKSIAQLDGEAEILAAAWPNDTRAPVLATVPHHHIYGILFRLFWPVRTGAVSHDRTHRYWGQLEAAAGPRAPVLVSSPAHLSRIPDSAPCHPEIIFSSGGPLPAAAAAETAARLGTWPIEVFGSTETGGVATRTQHENNTAWRPLPGVEISLAEDGGLNVRSGHADGDGFCALGDRGVILADGRFETRGRIGPVVKIEGVRVSLLRVDEAIGELAEVAACRTVLLDDGAARLGAVVVLSEAGQAALASEGEFRLSRRLRAAIAAKTSPAERPKAWRFVNAVPMNDQGKTTVQALRGLFAPLAGEGAQAVPLTDVSATDSEISARLVPAADAVWFSGHFPDRPILPGIAQVHLATRIAEQVWGWRPAGSNLMKVKFKRVVQPGAALSVHLTRKPMQPYLWFRFECEGVVTSSGRIGGSG